jgi:crossover junction endodeoxyribonuclease RuvC
MKVTVGIDPGLDGGLAVLSEEEKPLAIPLPWVDKELDARRLYDTLNLFYRAPWDVLVVIEKVSARPGQGVTSMFTFGCGYGEIKATAKILGCRWVLVPPQTWKKHVLAGTDKSKGATAAWALRTYPGLTPTLAKKSGLPRMGLVDALAIAHYGHHFHAR